MMATSDYFAAPRFLPIRPENIPELLRKETRWLCWKAGPPKPNGKFDKVPVNPQTGRNINGRALKHWLTFAQVMDAFRNGMADGIGFALSDRHPIIVDGVPFYVTVLDFDQCGPRMNEIQALWMELGQLYTEVSPSNNGLHMWGLSGSALKGGNAGAGRELYSGGRFVTMTGIGARGTFRECPGFAAVEQQWFPSQAMQSGVPPLPPIIGSGDFPGNLVLGPTGDNWFDRLSLDDRNACLAAMLQEPAVIALADTPDDAPSPNWRTILAACVRSGAPDAYKLGRNWAQTSPRFDPDDFDLRWGSYARG